MDRKHWSMKWGSMILALALAAMVPFAAFAETATGAATTADASAPKQQQRFEGNGRMRGGDFGAMLDVSTLTEEQKAVYDKAVTLYEQVEDAVLADLVTASVVTQADVDTYQANRTAEKALTAIDQSAWTAEQYKAYYEATQKTGDERTAALQALVDAGQLTQAQADAENSDHQSSLWDSILQNATTNTAIQTALGTMRQARQTLGKTLRDAGISGLGMGMFGGRGRDGAFGQNNAPGQGCEQNRDMDGGNRPNGQQGNGRQGNPSGGN